MMDAQLTASILEGQSQAASSQRESQEFRTSSAGRISLMLSHLPGA